MQTLELMWQMSPVENCISHSSSAFVYSFNPECFSLPRHLLICQRHHVQPLGLRPGLNGFGFAGNPDVPLAAKAFKISKYIKFIKLSTFLYFCVESLLTLISVPCASSQRVLLDERWWTIIEHIVNDYILPGKLAEDLLMTLTHEQFLWICIFSLHRREVCEFIRSQSQLLKTLDKSPSSRYSLWVWQLH